MKGNTPLVVLQWFWIQLNENQWLDGRERGDVYKDGRGEQSPEAKWLGIEEIFWETAGGADTSDPPTSHNHQWAFLWAQCWERRFKTQKNRLSGVLWEPMHLVCNCWHQLKFPPKCHMCNRSFWHTEKPETGVVCHLPNHPSHQHGHTDTIPQAIFWFIKIWKPKMSTVWRVLFRHGGAVVITDTTSQTVTNTSCAFCKEFVCSACLCVGFPWVLRFPPTDLKKKMSLVDAWI